MTSLLHPDAELELEEGGPPQEDLQEEGPRLGGTARGVAVADALLALHKTCRSFVLYDAKNEAIRKFLGLVRDKFAAALESWGTMVLEVRPFEFVMDGEVVYLERDRERSLAFRIFRDGVRKLTVEPEVSWEELLRFLEILSLRTVGANTAEEDAVTMLHKAGFEHILIDAIEGYVPDEEMPELAGPGARRSAIVHNHVEAPRDWDLPLPPFEAPALLQFRPVPPQLLASLREEGGPQTTTWQCLRLLQAMVEVVRDPTDPTTTDDVLPFAKEIRDYFLIDADLGSLAQLLVLLGRLPSRTNLPTQAEIMSDPGLYERALELLVAGGGDPRLERVLLPLYRERALVWLLERLDRDPDSEQKALLVHLLRPLVGVAPDLVLARLGTASLGALDALVPLVLSELRDRAYPVAMELVAREEPSAQRAGLKILAGLPLGTSAGPLLLPLLGSPDRELRQEAVLQASRLRDHESYQRLAFSVRDRGGKPFDMGEAEAVAMVLVRMNAEAAREQFNEWLKPAGLLERLTATGGVRMTQAVGVFGLALMPDLAAEAALRNLMTRAEEDLRRVILAALTRRRQREGRDAR